METLDPKEYRKVAYENAPLTDCSLETYINVLQLPIDEMAGKIVLDIGSGQKGKFAKEANEKNINVIALNPKLEDPKIRKKFLKPGWFEKKREDIKALAGLVQELPFKDNTFDFEVSLLGIPSHLPRKREDYEKAFNEIIRTLKPSGKAYFYPIPKDVYNNMDFQNTLKELSSLANVNLSEDMGSGYRLVISKYSKTGK